jgi:hypothetical protein
MGRPNPELLLWALQALCLNILDLVDTVVPLLTPFKLFIKEVEHREVETP